MSRGLSHSTTPPFVFPIPLVMGRSQGEARARQRSQQGRQKLSKAQSQADTSTPTVFKLFHFSLHSHAPSMLGISIQVNSFRSGDDESK